MPISFRRLIWILLLVSMAGNLLAEQASQVSVDDAWMREIPPGQPTSSGFMTLYNQGTSAVELVSAELDIAEVVELHTMSMNDQGQMSMRQVTGFEVAPGESHTLAPRGDHLMFMRLNATLRAGDQHPLTLHFADGSTTIIDITVQAN